MPICKPRSRWSARNASEVRRASSNRPSIVIAQIRSSAQPTSAAGIPAACASTALHGTSPWSFARADLPDRSQLDRAGAGAARPLDGLLARLDGCRQPPCQ